SHAKFLRAQCLVVARVKADQVMLTLFQPKHLRGQGLEGAQQFAILLCKQRHIGTTQLDIDHAALKSFRIARAVPGRDAVLETHASQFVEGGEESSDLLSSLLQVGDWHNGLVSQSRAGSGAPDFNCLSPVEISPRPKNRRGVYLWTMILSTPVKACPHSAVPGKAVDGVAQ